MTVEQLTPAEVKALRRVLDRVGQIVGNNSQWWTSKYGLEVLSAAWTDDARSARAKLGQGPHTTKKEAPTA